MKIIGENDVEWYSGKNARTFPKRVNVDGTWREVLSFEKQILEEFPSRNRYTIFLCHIGDNEIVKVKIFGC
ncbi:MAG: hypothetical protein ABIL44_00175 [candidate division WOR-3 bacterium]